jgi:NAD(P)-dependent dehydrogenase (short-subunit alcohol dehydrogenase family)
MSRIAIVTGANQGLGFALAAGLAHQLAPEDVVYLTGRDRARVMAAVERIAGARAQVRGDVLDVRDGPAVSAFADAIAARHGGVDIVFSNAAARLTPATPWAELVGPFVETNNLGTTCMLRAFDPILRPGGRRRTGRNARRRDLPRTGRHPGLAPVVRGHERGTDPGPGRGRAAAPRARPCRGPALPG